MAPGESTSIGSGLSNTSGGGADAPSDAFYDVPSQGGISRAGSWRASPAGEGAEAMAKEVPGLAAKSFAGLAERRTTGCSDLSEPGSPVGGRNVHDMSAREMREWHFVQQYYEDRIRTLSQFPVALVAFGLILIYFSGILCSLAISGLLWLIFSPLIESLSEPFFYPTHALLRIAGWRMLRRGEVRDEPNNSRCPCLLTAADVIARIRVPRLICVMLVLVFVGFCFWLLIAKTFASVIGVLRNSDSLLTLLSSKADDVRILLDESVLGDTVDWDAVIEQMVSHAREMTTEESIESMIWSVIKVVRVSLGNFFLVFLMFMFLTLAGDTRYPSTRKNRPKSEQVVVIEKYLYAQTFLSLLTAVLNGTIYGYLHVPASFLFALTTFWLNFIPVVGSVIAVILPMPLALIVLEMRTCAAAFVLPCIVQLAIGNTLYPILMGRTMLLHPVTILVGMSMFGTLLSIPGMILSVPILGVLKSFLQATDHPYAQVCSYVLEGSIGKAIRSWETARHRLIASASALSPHPHNLPHSNSHGHGASSESLGHGHHPSFSSRRAAPDGAVGADVSPALLPRAQTMHEKPPTQPPLGGKSYRRLMD